MCIKCGRTLTVMYIASTLVIDEQRKTIAWTLEMKVCFTAFQNLVASVRCNISGKESEVSTRCASSVCIYRHVRWTVKVEVVKVQRTMV